ncbi:MAG: SH3 domain-containing protein [Sphaerochaetaceae bacterium]|nr:SH3 domain-containing protein [Sphaerochaetaceae bacterium]
MVIKINCPKCNKTTPISSNSCIHCQYTFKPGEADKILKKNKIIGSVFLLLLFSICIYLIFIKPNKINFNDKNNDVFIVNTSGLNVRTGPNSNDSILFVLQEGEEVNLLNDGEVWVEIESNGQSGFVNKDLIVLKEKSKEKRNSIDWILLLVIASGCIKWISKYFNRSTSNSKRKTPTNRKVISYTKKGMQGNIEFYDEKNNKIGSWGSNGKEFIDHGLDFYLIKNLNDTFKNSFTSYNIRRQELGSKKTTGMLEFIKIQNNLMIFEEKEGSFIKYVYYDSKFKEIKRVSKT